MVLVTVVSIILLVGVVLLAIWKLVITIHDRREFSRFQSARSRARYEMVRCSLLPVYLSFSEVRNQTVSVFISHTSGLQSSVQAACHYTFCRDRFQHVRKVLQRRAPLIHQHRARQDRSNKQIPGGQGRSGLNALIALHSAQMITQVI